VSSDAVVIIVLVVAIAVTALAVVLVRRKTNGRARLRERFGPEYERAVGADGNAKKAEIDLRGRVERHDKLTLRSLSSGQRDRYSQDWRQVQATFVDAPRAALAQADDLITDALVARGYPMQDFEQQAQLISVDHPQVVENYRQAHGVYVRSRASQVSTEELRQAFVSYRALFSELLDDSGVDDGGASEGNHARRSSSSTF
jgi:hypothetical protein